jgi:hypothetical protein
MELPASPGARYPSIDAANGRLVVSWVQPGSKDESATIFVTERVGETWDEPAIVSEDERLMINWADFPEPQILGTDGLAMHWLVRAGGPQFAYGIRLAQRGADRQWSVPVIPHGQDHAAEHGFVSLVPDDASAVDTLWLDGREMGRGGTMELRHARWDPSGRLGPQQVIDADVCTCCQTDATRVGENLLVVYRDHAPGEIRDISIVRQGDNGWESPSRFSNDGWQISACPVNGPAIDSAENHVVVAWFTQANDEPKVLARDSTDGGVSWSETRRIDDGDPIGRVDVTMLAEGAWAVSWIENDETDAAVRVRRYNPEQEEMDESMTLGLTGAQRDSGFPRIDFDGERLWATWTETSRPSQLRLSTILW